MRSAQVYRWQIPHGRGGGSARQAVKKPATGCMFACVKASAKGGEISPLPGFSQETREEAQSVLLCSG